ncbi:MAG: RNA-binding cell elongation regulator Jag/EloR [Clostridia bacterium]|jgi:spoIIIJ-associated protein|nr:protein jag [Clostridia bacterium]MDH7573395.1 RNA-binding cell elongation regulator Jag/EloR [Clostridia bacterium]
MRTVEAAGKTVEEAIEFGLQELGAPREEVEVEVLEAGSKGFLGLGARLARVRLTWRQDFGRLALEFLQEVFRVLGVAVRVEVSERDGCLYVACRGKGLGVLIGRRGETLDALQYLVNLVVRKRAGRQVRIVLDVENYRRRREDTLVRLARRLSEKVKRTGNRVVLEPMTPHERRIIHMALQGDSQVYTFSEGEEPFRKVVIALRR